MVSDFGCVLRKYVICGRSRPRVAFAGLNTATSVSGARPNWRSAAMSSIT